jgi:DNA-binding MarR family transcriptional regulator
MKRTPQALASAMQVSKATMSHSLKVLEKRGFIEIRPCEQDARSKLVYLTDSGRHFHSQAITASARTFGSFLTDEHRQAMVGAMPALVTIRRLLDENREPLTDDRKPAGSSAGTSMTFAPAPTAPCTCRWWRASPLRPGRGQSRE